ncbi:hypothetical protein ACO2Q2_07030 [Dyella sp. KRB-257]|uniref:hypothetical protein n=1 Tax=Dyella sp. KRB-257 TaxID=3400915 RepID=UPI003C0CAB1C
MSIKQAGLITGDCGYRCHSLADRVRETLRAYARGRGIGGYGPRDTRLPERLIRAAMAAICHASGDGNALRISGGADPARCDACIRHVR